MTIGLRVFNILNYWWRYVIIRKIFFEFRLHKNFCMTNFWTESIFIKIFKKYLFFTNLCQIYKLNSLLDFFNLFGFFLFIVFIFVILNLEYVYIRIYIFICIMWETKIHFQCVIKYQNLNGFFVYADVSFLIAYMH